MSDYAAGLAARVVVSFCVLSIVVVGLFVRDGEGRVARCLPRAMANFMRDRPETWEVKLTLNPQARYADYLSFVFVVRVYANARLSISGRGC